uniref:Uncharacterized protein n=1 Tax=Anguilla anguilla TaxID=7936 RepID=A0A0E9S3Y5_ANGAN
MYRFIQLLSCPTQLFHREAARKAPVVGQPLNNFSLQLCDGGVPVPEMTVID